VTATVAETVEVYEILKPRLGDQETKYLLRFIEDRTVHLVRDEIAKGLVTRGDLTRELAPIKEDLAEVHREIARLDQRITTEVAGLNEKMTAEFGRLDQRITTEVARLDQKITTEIARLEKQILAYQSQTRLYLLAIGALILLTNPRVLDFLGRLLGLAPGP